MFGFAIPSSSQWSGKKSFLNIFCSSIVITDCSLVEETYGYLVVLIFDFASTVINAKGSFLGKKISDVSGLNPLLILLLTEMVFYIYLTA
jgi:hypothetical protein